MNLSFLILPDLFFSPNREIMATHTPGNANSGAREINALVTGLLFCTTLLLLVHSVEPEHNGDSPQMCSYDISLHKANCSYRVLCLYNACKCIYRKLYHLMFPFHHHCFGHHSILSVSHARSDIPSLTTLMPHYPHKHPSSTCSFHFLYHPAPHLI